MLRTTVLLMLHLICLVSTSFASDNTYTNEIVGIEITKPKGWFFMSNGEITENRQRVSLDDKDFEKRLKERARLPIVAFCKYKNPETRLDVSPAVNVVFSNLGELMAMKPDNILRELCNSLEKQFSDFKYILSPTITKLSNKDAAKTIVNYTLVNQSGYIFKVRSEMWIVPKKNRVLIIGMAAPAQGPDQSEVEFEAVLKSIILR
jgi:hypothetical protein